MEIALPIATMTLNIHIPLPRSKLNQLQVSGSRLIRRIKSGVRPKTHTPRLPPSPPNKSRQEVVESPIASDVSSQENTIVAIDEDQEENGILTRIVTGLQGFLQPPETAKLFQGLTDSQIQKAMEIIQRLSEDDLLWCALTQGRPLKRRRLPRVQLMLSQTTGVLPPHLEVTTSDRGQYVERMGGQSNLFTAVFQGKKVALKRMRVYLSMDQDQIRALKKQVTLEAILWSQLRHPNVLPFLGLESQGEDIIPLIVLPWHDRGNVMLHMKCLEPPAPAAQLNKWIFQVTSGLDYLHEQEVVHGDLRCHNVLISDDDTALLCDFGLSVFASDHSNNYSSQRGGHDRCMAPELMDPGKFGLVSTRPTFASDVYSLGCLCYEIYTQTMPFELYNLVPCQRKILNGDRPDRPPRSDYPPISDEVWKITEKAWGQQPSERPTANQVLLSLKKIVLHA
ncbi:hypothetical protein QCA50_003922 [Cerrena zonata]|uniref:Protein kinase domain-containing protein n=1 Tax=Cerrena zonata TaxID=2478898 RepID=A0AAW0GK41_9APHY